MEQAVIYSPVGPLTLFAEDDFLTALVYGDYGGYDDIPLFREARRQLDEYFDGQRQAFHLPLRPEGTEFQKKVWQVLCRIPYGQMISTGSWPRGWGRLAPSRPWARPTATTPCPS